jgi:glycosyltransferase involved in cell wall biosynthesis
MTRTIPPAVSVVMGAYNGEKYLRQAVQSVLDQTFRDFEFIIVNDGSTDGTAGILQELTDQRIRIIRNERNEGLTGCLIKGCNVARGKYIARMDADDISHPERLEKEIAFLDAHPEYGAVGCCYHVIDTDGVVVRSVKYPLHHEELARSLRISNVLVHGAVLFRADVYRQTGGYREFFQYTQDYDLWLRMSERAKLGNLPDFLYQHRHHHQKIAVRHIFGQRLYAHLARRCAEQRISSGVDPLMKEDFAAVKSLLDEARPKNFLKRHALVSQYYAEFARDFDGLKMKHLRRLIAASFLNNPCNGTLWKLLLSTKFRTRIQQGLRRKVREMTREGI